MTFVFLLVALLIVAIGTAGPAYVLAKTAGPVVPFAFIAAYVLAVGAITFIMFISRAPIDIGDPDIDWLMFGILTVLFTPSAISALLACWFSRPLARRDAAALLCVYLFLILVAIGAALTASRGEFWFLIGEFAILSTTFFVVALWKRVAKGEQHEPSALRGNSGR